MDGGSPSPVRSTLYCMPLASVMTPSLFLFSARNFSPTALEPRARAHEHRRSAARSIGGAERKLLDHVTGVEEPELSTLGADDPRGAKDIVGT